MASCPAAANHPLLRITTCLVLLTRGDLFDGTGPVNRFWFDGTSSNPCATTTQLWEQVYKVSSHALSPCIATTLFTLRMNATVPGPPCLPNRNKTIRTVSPWTMITAYRGDVCAAKNGQTLYVRTAHKPEILAFPRLLQLDCYLH